MSKETKKPVFDQGAKFYLLICAAALGLMVLPLLAYGMREWSLILPMVGGLALVLRWRSGPFLFLAGFLWYILAAIMSVTPLGLLQYIFQAIPRMIMGYRVRYFGSDWAERLFHASPVIDFLLCFSVLIYLIGHYRFLGITRNIMPVDRRQKSRYQSLKRKGTRKRLEPYEEARSSDLVQPQEGLSILFSGLIVVAVAQFVLLWLNARDADIDLDRLTRQGFSFRMQREAWQFLTLIWVGGLLLFLIFSLIGYLSSRRITLEEAELMLQDDLWKDTRREQSKIQRWITWGNKRRT